MVRSAVEAASEYRGIRQTPGIHDDRKVVIGPRWEGSHARETGMERTSLLADLRFKDK